MFHQDSTLERRAGQRWILAIGPGIREHARRQLAQEEAVRSRHEQEERPDGQPDG